jgi:hypothetical protein
VSCCAIANPALTRPGSVPRVKLFVSMIASAEPSSARRPASVIRRRAILILRAPIRMISQRVVPPIDVRAWQSVLSKDRTQLAYQLREASARKGITAAPEPVQGFLEKLSLLGAGRARRGE